MKRFGTLLVTIVALALLAVSPALANSTWTGIAPANASWTGKAPGNASWTGKAPGDVRQRTRRSDVRVNAEWTWRPARVAPLSRSDGN